MVLWVEVQRSDELVPGPGTPPTPGTSQWWNVFMCVGRYLGTILGSSVISTTVLGDEQPVSAAVSFQLQHAAAVCLHDNSSTISQKKSHMFVFLTATLIPTESGRRRL